MRPLSRGKETASRVFWALVFCSMSTGVRVGLAIAADQTGAGNGQLSGSTLKSAPGGKATAGIKITVIKSIGAQALNKTATKKSPAGDQADELIKPKPAAKSQPQPTRTASEAKSQPSSPVVSPPPRAQPQTNPNVSAAAHEDPAPASEDVITVEGIIAGVDLKAIPPTIQLILPLGSTFTLTADPVKTSVMKESRAGRLEDLQVRDHVNVGYTPKDGAHVIKSIEIKGASDPLPSPLSSTAAVGASKTGGQ